MRTRIVEDEEFLADMIAEGLRRDALTGDVAYGRHLALSRGELGVPEVPIRAEGAAVSGDDLIEQVREEYSGYRTDAVRVSLGGLRAEPGEPQVVDTVPGHGYRIGGAT